MTGISLPQKVPNSRLQELVQCLVQDCCSLFGADLLRFDTGDRAVRASFAHRSAGLFEPPRWELSG